MAIKYVTGKCPECNAPINAELGRPFIYCSYCGAKVLLVNENEYVIRTIDEAGIAKANAKKAIRMRELDLEEENQSHSIQTKTILLYLWIAAIVIIAAISIVIAFTVEAGGLFAFCILGYIGGPIVGGGAYLLFKAIPDRERNERREASGGIRFPKSRTVLRDQYYKTISSELKAAGFTNVKCVNLHDVKLGLFQKEGAIEQVLVDGKETLFGGNVYRPNVPIVITYHGR